MADHASIEEVYRGAEKIINDILRKEMIAQGHHLTGAMEDSLHAEIFKKRNAEVMAGFAVHYTKFVNHGFPASSASYKQIPFLIEYFIKRGYPVKSTSGPDATSLAFGTVTKWMKEGMPTQASKRFSSTGSRTNMIENAFVGNKEKIDEYMLKGFNSVIDKLYRKVKREII
jgi:hypothetical protein